MQIVLAPERPLSNDSCLADTGKTLDQWVDTVRASQPERGRRVLINELYDAMGRGKDVWWATTVWVEYERRQGIVNKKDGLGEGYNICVTKSVGAPPEVVYGAWIAAMGGAGEGQGYSDTDGNSGTWLRLRPGKDARLSWKTAGIENLTQVDIAFAAAGAKTAVTLNHARIQTRDESDGLREAWAKLLTELKTALESQ